MGDSLGRIDLVEGPGSKGWAGCELSHNVLFNDAEHPESIWAASFGAVKGEAERERAIFAELQNNPALECRRSRLTAKLATSSVRGLMALAQLVFCPVNFWH